MQTMTVYERPEEISSDDFIFALVTFLVLEACNFLLLPLNGWTISFGLLLLIFLVGGTNRTPIGYLRSILRLGERVSIQAKEGLSYTWGWPFYTAGAVEDAKIIPVPFLFITPSKGKLRAILYVPGMILYRVVDINRFQDLDGGHPRLKEILKVQVESSGRSVITNTEWTDVLDNKAGTKKSVEIAILNSIRSQPGFVHNDKVMGTYGIEIIAVNIGDIKFSDRIEPALEKSLQTMLDSQAEEIEAAYLVKNTKNLARAISKPGGKEAIYAIQAGEEIQTERKIYSIELPGEITVDDVKDFAGNAAEVARQLGNRSKRRSKVEGAEKKKEEK